MKPLIETIYKNTPRLQELLREYDLEIDDIAIQFAKDGKIFAAMSDKPITVGYDVEKDKIVGVYTSFIHPKIEARLREV